MSLASTELKVRLVHWSSVRFTRLRVDCRGKPAAVVSPRVSRCAAMQPIVVVEVPSCVHPRVEQNLDY